MPNVLTLHLKRFNSQMQKINRNMKFQNSMDISRFGEGNGKYELYSVLVHQGGTCFSGHYYSYVKSPAKFWYKMDDSYVKEASTERIMNEDAYILFYVKKELNPQKLNGIVDIPLQKNIAILNDSNYMKINEVSKTNDVSEINGNSEGKVTSLYVNGSQKRKNDFTNGKV